MDFVYFEGRIYWPLLLPQLRILYVDLVLVAADCLRVMNDDCDFGGLNL